LSRAHGIAAANAGDGFLDVESIAATDRGEIARIILRVDGTEEACWGNGCENSGRESKKREDD